jgi:putative transposase
MTKPSTYHPWSYQGVKCQRNDFDTDASYWRYWSKRLNLTSSARLRLEWIIFYYTIGACSGTTTAFHFGISRRVFIKWRKRFNPHDLTSLEGYSRTPHTKRSWTVTTLEEDQVKKLRENHMKWGKKKLQSLYIRTHGVSISTNKIQKIINKHNLFPDHNVAQNRKKQERKRKQKTYIHTFNRHQSLGFLWHTDAIIIYWYGVRKVIFTALEDITKIGYARAYTTNSSKNATDFLTRLRYLSNNQVLHIHHDNGGEFAKYFEKACKELCIPQIYSRVRTPRDNASLERFNRTIQEEWLAMSNVGLDELTSTNEDITKWLTEYNTIRPHQSLDYLTPIEYATKHFKVSPMW